MIETQGLTRRFGERTAVDDLTFEVKDGEVFGLLGPNGAGKTTTVRMLAGLIRATGGTARVGGFEVGSPEGAQHVREIAGVVPDNVGLYEPLSAYRNLDFFGRLYGCQEPRRGENIRRLLGQLGLWEERDRPVATYSKGMKQKIAIARALVHEPKVLFLDEPTANLDPEASLAVRELLLEVRKEGRTVLLNTHNLDEARRICDRIGILKTRLVALGTPEMLSGTVHGRRTAIRLEAVTPAVLEAVRALAPREVRAEGDRLLLDLADPAAETPGIVAAIARAGGRIREVTEESASLEEVYLKYVREGR